MNASLRKRREKERTSYIKENSSLSSFSSRTPWMVGRAFPSLQKPEMGRDFSDKWILIKRVPAGVSARLPAHSHSPFARTRCALTTSLIRPNPPFVRVRSSSFVEEIVPLPLLFLSPSEINRSGRRFIGYRIARRHDESSSSGTSRMRVYAFVSVAVESFSLIEHDERTIYCHLDIDTAKFRKRAFFPGESVFAKSMRAHFPKRQTLEIFYRDVSNK